ncbi:MAG: ABC transporter permease [Bacteroidales bacterium]|nr:ABC transporter permease [Bacteroidales bacterium]
MRLAKSLQDIFEVFLIEVKRVLSDGGVILIFFIASLLYPLLFGAIYKNEMVRNVPVAVVDQSKSEDSHRFIQKIDATPEVVVRYRCNTMAEAEQLMKERKINGIVFFPQDYSTSLAEGQQAFVSLFCDMSSFLYYRSVYSGVSAAMLDEMEQVQLRRYASAGVTGESAEEQISPIPFEDVKLYSPGGGFTSFLVPGLLVLVVHQTLFLGIGILFGTTREDRKSLELIPQRLRHKSIYRVNLGRALAYLLLYIPVVAVVLFLIPHWFGLPHIGHIGDILLFLLPFMLATIFFCMTVGSFIRHRDSGILCFFFFSILLVFLSGLVWPQSKMPTFWRHFSYLFPSTHGLQGFIRINSMGARLKDVQFEYIFLWVQAGVYFITNWLMTYLENYRHLKRNELREKIRMQIEMRQANKRKSSK